jgi:hypothetical protein
MVRLDCRLRRRKGAVVTGRTVDVGTGGMRVSTGRPLTTDELLAFELELAGEPGITGEATVLRAQGYGVYALRFERLPRVAQDRLGALASAT